MKSTPLIIFDLDGTLVDSTEDIVRAFAHSLAQFDIDHVETDAIRQLIGKPLNQAFHSLLPERYHSLVPRCVEQFRAYYFEHCLDHSRPFPGVPELLNDLKTRGFTLAVATTKRGFMAKKVVEGLGLTDFFELVQGTDELPAKPDPAILFHVCQQLNRPTQEAMMVGDTDNDVLAAKRAGMASCAVCWGAWSKDRLHELQPDWLLEHPTQLLDILVAKHPHFN